MNKKEESFTLSGDFSTEGYQNAPVSFDPSLCAFMKKWKISK